MSYTAGPCPGCGANTMYDDRTPTLCVTCRPILKELRRQGAVYEANKKAQLTGNRKQRRSERSKSRGR